MSATCRVCGRSGDVSLKLVALNEISVPLHHPRLNGLTHSFDRYLKHGTSDTAKRRIRAGFHTLTNSDLASAGHLPIPHRLY